MCDLNSYIIKKIKFKTLFSFKSNLFKEIRYLTRLILPDLHAIFKIVS